MSDVNTAPIGVFDSGVGGLTVIAEMLKELPAESYVYFADSAHVPYGPRPPEELREFAAAITRFLVGQGCKMIIIACNTSTSVALDVVQHIACCPVLGVIEPAVERALQLTENNRIGVIATEATVKSGAYQQSLRRKNPAVEVTAVACPLFVELVEKGRLSGPEVSRAAGEYLRPLVNKGIDCLIMGCTHYPYLLPVIRDVLGPSVRIVDPAKETVARAGRILAATGLAGRGENPDRRYYTSGLAGDFRQTGRFFLQQEIDRVQTVVLA